MEIIWIKSFPHHPDMTNNQIIYNLILCVCVCVYTGSKPIITEVQTILFAANVSARYVRKNEGRTGENRTKSNYLSTTKC